MEREVVVESGAGWVTATGRPAPALLGMVGGYAAYRERTAAPVARREVAHPAVVLVVGLGDPLEVAGRLRSSFVAGLAQGPTGTWHPGAQDGIELRLAPLAAYQLFGLPMEQLADQVVDLADLWGRTGRELPERLAAAPDRAARFDLLDGALLRAANRGPRPAPELAEAWARLERSRGTVGVGELATVTGWSRGRLAARFRQQVGLAPKAVARIIRFDRAVTLLCRPGPRSLAGIALAAGYFDQAHLNRDFRALAGCTPVAYLRARLPDLPGVADVQDLQGGGH